MSGYIQNSTTRPACSLNDTKFKLMVINRTKKTGNCNAASLVLWKQMFEGEGTKREASKHQFHPKIFIWPQA
jgi:hypothetical protein